MAVVPLNRVEAGMVLSGEVRDRRGCLLMPAGQVLEEKHLQALRLWGIGQVEVVGDGVEETPEPEGELEPWALEAAEATLSPLFVHARGSHPVVEALYELCVLRRARALQQEGRDER